MPKRELRSIRPLVLLALCASAACSGTQSGSGGSGHGGTSQNARVRTYTDSDAVTGVAAAGDYVYVATRRGVLRYPSAGGAPTRITTEQGLPSNQVFAIATSGEGVVWVGTRTGVARLFGERFDTVSPVQPDIGVVTAVLPLSGGGLLAGGSRGLARWDGTDWYLLSNQYQVTGFAMHAGRPLVATAQSGVLALRGEMDSLDEFSSGNGLPEDLVRNVVATEGGKYWALVQGSHGAKLAYYDGTRWFGYTSERIRDPWMALIPSPSGGAMLITPAGAYELSEREGEELYPTDAAQPTTGRRVELQPERLVPPPPPAPPVEETAPPPGHGRGRGRARPAGRGQHAPAGVVAVRAYDDSEDLAFAEAVTRGYLAVDGTGDQRGAQAGRGNGRGRVAARDAGAGSASSDAGATSASADGSTPAGSDGGAAAVNRPAPRRPRDIPDYAAPVEVPHEGPRPEAPAYGLKRVSDLRVPEDISRAFSSGNTVYVSRAGLGVTRIAGGEGVDYRSHDLAMQHRPLSLATTDTVGNVWLVTESGNSVRYNGSRFDYVTLDTEGTAIPMMFWSRGATIAAVGRVGNNIVRTYRYQAGNWQQITERPIDMGGAGTVDVKSLAVDPHGRYWLGLRVVTDGHPREYGVAVIDENLPAATQFNTQVPPQGAPQGGAPAPDDLTAVEFDAQGTAWFAGLTGATSISLPEGGATPATVRTYGEAQGVRGDQVLDLSRGPQNKIFIATPEGLGYWDGNSSRFLWDIVGSTDARHVTALALDVNNALWGVGVHGGWVFDGTSFKNIGTADGLPSEEFVDVAVDGMNRVWFVTPDGITILNQAVAH